MLLSWFEAPITNPPPSKEVLGYQKYYKEKSSKPFLTGQEFNELSERSDEMIKNTDSNINSLLLFKLFFAFLIALSAFVITKYLLHSLNKLSGVFTILACLISMVWFVSSFEFVIYIIFCTFGALLAQKFSKAIQPGQPPSSAASK